MIRDITANSHEKRRLQSVFAAVAEGIVVQTVSGEIVDCNASAERILGLRLIKCVGELRLIRVGKPFERMGRNCLEKSIQRWLRFVRKAAAGFRFWYSHARECNAVDSVNTEPILDSSGELSMVVSSFTDITQFREQSQRLQVIVDASKIGTWDWDVQTGTAIFNDHWASMLGYEIDEIEPHVSTWERIIDPPGIKRHGPWCKII